MEVKKRKRSDAPAVWQRLPVYKFQDLAEFEKNSLHSIENSCALVFGKDVVELPDAWDLAWSLLAGNGWEWHKFLRKLRPCSQAACEVVTTRPKDETAEEKRPERPPSRRDPNTYIVHLNPTHTHIRSIQTVSLKKREVFGFIPAFSPGLPGNEKNLQTNEERKTRPEQSLVALVLGVQRSIGCIGRCEADGRRAEVSLSTQARRCTGKRLRNCQATFATGNVGTSGSSVNMLQFHTRTWALTSWILLCIAPSCPFFHLFSQSLSPRIERWT